MLGLAACNGSVRSVARPPPPASAARPVPRAWGAAGPLLVHLQAPRSSQAVSSAPPGPKPRAERRPGPRRMRRAKLKIGSGPGDAFGSGGKDEDAGEGHQIELHATAALSRGLERASRRLQPVSACVSHPRTRLTPLVSPPARSRRGGAARRGRCRAAPHPGRPRDALPRPRRPRGRAAAGCRSRARRTRRGAGAQPARVAAGRLQVRRRGCAQRRAAAAHHNVLGAIALNTGLPLNCCKRHHTCSIPAATMTQRPAATLTAPPRAAAAAAAAARPPMRAPAARKGQHPLARQQQRARPAHQQRAPAKRRAWQTR